MALTMVPPAGDLPAVLPTDRLSESGRPRPDLRAGLRRIPDGRNAATVAGAWIQSFGVVAAAAVIDRWWAYLVAFFLMGRAMALLNILGHEAAHRLLFSRKAVNDVVGRWLLAYPAFTPFDVYRRSHMAHHRDELGPDEPDLMLYNGYPITRSSMRRKLVRDAVGISGYKNLKPLLGALTKRSSRGVAGRIVGAQVVIWVALGAATGRWWLYPLLWLAPWMTVWRVLNRLRAIAEHAGMERSPDRRRTTHVVRQRPMARFWIVPYHTGWHLAHHVDMGIPWRRLPDLHRELVASGWVTPRIEYPSYTALWRALCSRPEPVPSVAGAGPAVG
ncbi:MAG TPA: fatty acid desaturase family protein [Acidimicrobiales bacterium]|nr:fatty acid desaturase family protein [Acidimicrobiales bacterium]